MATTVAAPMDERKQEVYGTREGEREGQWSSSSSSRNATEGRDCRPPPPPSSLSPLANPLLLGPPFATSVLSAPAGIGSSAGGGRRGTEGGRSRSRSASGVGPRRLRANSARPLRSGLPPSSASASTFPTSGGGPRALLGDVRRVQHAAEWLSSCPLHTLRVLQQRVLVAIESPLHAFLGTPWFMVPEKPISSLQRGQRKEKEKRRPFLKDDEEEDDDEDESDEEPVIPPTPLSFTAFLTQFILVTYASGLQDVRDALLVERENHRNASRSKSSSSRRRRRRRMKGSDPLHRRPRSSDTARLHSNGSETPTLPISTGLSENICAFLPPTTTASSSVSASGSPLSPHASQTSRKLSMAVLSESPRKAGISRHLNRFLSSGRPPRVATLSASDFPYGPQEELYYPSTISVSANRHRGTVASTPRSPALSPSSSSPSPILPTRSKRKGASRRHIDRRGPSSPLSRGRGRAGLGGTSLTGETAKEGKAEEEQLLQSELMHWSLFFEQFFDPSHEGQCRDPLSLYAAILLACAAAGRRVLTGGTDAKLNRELAKHCLYRPDTHCSHCDACDTLRWNIRAHWRCTLLQYRDRLYTAASRSCQNAEEEEVEALSSPPGKVGMGHACTQCGGMAAAAPISGAAALSFPSSVVVVRREKEEEEACNMAQGIRFFLGTPTIVWWAVCFFQLYRTSGGGAVPNPIRTANAPPSWAVAPHSRGKNGKKKSGAAGGGGTSEEKAPRDTLRPGEVFTICDWITRQAEQEEEMLRLQESVGSVWLSPPSHSAAHARDVRVGFTKDGVLCAVQKITHWARERVRAGLPLDVQDFLLLLRREFPIVAYYSTFFDSTATCR